jgi:AraC-like DNA-binding protein/mannose-6-phosphate isomerase-like protein (cupin superfamily)
MDKLLLGSEKLKAIDINTQRPGVDIWIDFMHIYKFAPEEEFVPHGHENMEFHYIADGEGEVGFLKKGTEKETMLRLPALVKSSNKPLLKEYHIKPNDRVDDDYVVYKVQKGDAFLNPPGQIHWQRSSKGKPIVEYAIRFTFEENNQECNQEGSSGKYYRKENTIIRKLLEQDIIQVSHDNEEIKSLFDNVFLEAYYEMPGYVTKIKNKIFNIVIEVSRIVWNKRHLKYHVPEVDMNQTRLKLMDDYIYTNLASSIKIKDLAKNVFMSERSLSRFVKNHKGVSVHKYIIHIRVNKAVEFIRSSSNPKKLSEIAFITGFSSISHLSATIKNYTGKNPSRF